MNFLRLLTNEKPRGDEENADNKDDNANKDGNVNKDDNTNKDDNANKDENVNKDDNANKDENVNNKDDNVNNKDDNVKNEIPNNSSIVDNSIKEKCESQNEINDETNYEINGEKRLIKDNITTFSNNITTSSNNITTSSNNKPPFSDNLNYKTDNDRVGEKRKLNNRFIDHNNEDKLSEDEEEKDFEYYYKKTIDFINTEFFETNDEIKDILNISESDSKSSSDINKINITHDNNSPNKYVLEKMPFCKLINFEKNISTERQRVLNYYNEDRKQIYESSINKERQFSHIFQNTEKYYDAKEILAFLLPYHTFYLDHINIDEDDEDIELINNTENEIKEIEQSINEMKQSFVAYVNPSIVWSLGRIADRTNHRYKKCRKICE
ncbi:hypothetical protein YYC_03378 [Plasmodium yoelii 17X]|uniref:Uncharacterized protein n=1 Tax=Plasmodium yoelii 17X TaxID=1323249 RepID=V7PK04_PLAYE|nr:hypothetical protein YYC_03378 [Plasmodium yoelii 17X]